MQLGVQKPKAREIITIRRVAGGLTGPEGKKYSDRQAAG
jgi:hypothetical protein